MRAAPASDDFAQRGRWRSFVNPAIEREYRLWHRDQILPVSRVVGLVAFFGWLLAPVWFLAVLGEMPRAGWQGVAVALLAFALMWVATFSRLNRWTNEGVAFVNIVIGLDFMWVMAKMYGPLSGPFGCAAFLTLFYPVILRMRTAAALVVTVVITCVPAALLIRGTQRGDIALADSWPYLALLLPNVPIIVLAAAQIEAGMRRQFAAQRTIERQQRDLEASQRLIRRFAPAAVAARIESGDAEAVGVPQRLRVTALSSDVAGFTELADRLDPESLSHIINEYVATMSAVIEGAGGVVTEFAGDGLMAIFGAPEQVEPVVQVHRALAAAESMHERLAELNDTWFHLGIERPLRVRVGINTGVLSVGTFGSDGRATYTAIGLQMNIAARIQAHCQPGSTLLSSSSWHLVRDDVACDALGEVSVKGVHFPISIYAPTGGSATTAT